MSKEQSSASRSMTDAQREYEAKRAQKAGMSLEKWLDQKRKQVAAAQAKPLPPVRKPGLLSRLVERANQPLRKS